VISVLCRIGRLLIVLGANSLSFKILRIFREVIHLESMTVIGHVRSLPPWENSEGFTECVL